jgi:hypothetical protein
LTLFANITYAYFILTLIYMNSTQTQGFKYKCLECQNENSVPSDTKVGTYCECDFCGIEYEVASIEDAGSGVCTLKIVEEEK